MLREPAAFQSAVGRWQVNALFRLGKSMKVYFPELSFIEKTTKGLKIDRID